MSEIPGKRSDLQKAFAILSEKAVGGEDCPALDAIWEAARGEAPARSRAAVVEHTTFCYACAEAWRLAFEFSDRNPAGAASVTRRSIFQHPARPIWAGLAAAALLVVAVGIGVALLPREPAPIVTRAGEKTAITSQVPETTPLSRDACTLRWSTPSALSRYTLRVGAEDLSPIAFEPNLSRSEYTVPAKALEKLPSGATIVWRVEADLPDGRHIASEAFENKVK